MYSQLIYFKNFGLEEEQKDEAPTRSFGVIRANEQQEHVSPPVERNSHSFVRDNKGKMYLFGGANAGGPLNDLFEYDEASQSWLRLATTGTAPPAIEMHTSHVWNHMNSDGTTSSKLLVVGGRATDMVLYNQMMSGQQVAQDPSSLSANIYQLNLDTKEWSVLTQLPTPVCSHCSTLLMNRYLILYGGLNGISLNKTIVRVDLETLEFRTYAPGGDISNYLGALAEGRLATSMATTSHDSDEGLVVLFGGSSIQEDYSDLLTIPIRDLVDDSNFKEITEIM